MTSIATPSSRRRPSEDAETERLFAEHSERLLAYCFRKLGSRAEAEDAVQVTFLCALRALRRGVVPESEAAWLHAIARNVCRWHHRSASRRPVASAVEVESVATPEQAEDTELLAELEDALESLPERQRQALLLREWRGLSAHEIADHLELSTPATHALLTRARRSLAHALTAPRRAALGLASVAYELRSWIKAAVSGASAKAAVATIAVAGAGAGALAVDQSLRKADGRSTTAAGVAGRDAEAAGTLRPAAGSRAAAAASAAGAWRASGTADAAVRFGHGLRGFSSGGERLSGPWRPGSAAGGADVAADPRTLPERTTPGSPGAPTAGPVVPPSASEIASQPTLPPAPPLPELDPPAVDPPDLPQLPTVDVPPLDPPDLPPLPEVDLPTVDLPPLPKLDPPAIDPPDLPPSPTVDVPPLDPPDLPTLPEADLPPLEPPPLPKLP